MAETIEDIILDHDKRGMLALRPHVPADFCGRRRSTSLTTQAIR